MNPLATLLFSLFAAVVVGSLPVYPAPEPLEAMIIDYIPMPPAIYYGGEDVAATYGGYGKFR